MTIPKMMHKGNVVIKSHLYGIRILLSVSSSSSNPKGTVVKCKLVALNVVRGIVIVFSSKEKRNLTEKKLTALLHLNLVSKSQFLTGFSIRNIKLLKDKKGGRARSIEHISEISI